MPKFRNKPVIIEAFCYGCDSRPTWFDNEVTNNNVITHVGTDIKNISDYWCEIKTLEGVMACSCGDYVIQGVNGELYPCKPDIFEKTYEAV